MAKKNTATAENAKGSALHAKRIKVLQTTVDRTCDAIVGTTRSLTTRAIKARSVDPKVVEAAFTALEEAIQDGREEYAEAQQGDEVGRVSRVDLASL